MPKVNVSDGVTFGSLLRALVTSLPELQADLDAHHLAAREKLKNWYAQQGCDLEDPAIQPLIQAALPQAFQYTNHRFEVACQISQQQSEAGVLSAKILNAYFAKRFSKETKHTDRVQVEVNVIPLTPEVVAFPDLSD